MKLALIGCGKWGKNYLKTLKAIEDCELKWVCDLDYKKLNHVADVYPETRFTVNIKDIMCDSEVQGVIIALMTYVTLTCQEPAPPPSLPK